ncbi:MAG TPA: SAM-dependent chlorinase/fluorinase [Gemmataceae bacterium]|nr:SAM-dependent chlorinase/fluorinase [Gemmataceae bacterium]
MSDPIITLTTDFGEESPYVAAMKGVILGINRSARILDLSHQIPPQNLAYAAYFLSGAVPHFPPDALHVIVVDPGVGTERALLYVEVAGHRLLVPDNGCWTELISLANSAPLVLRLAEPRYWRHPVSATFHGRDILASVAGHLSVGADPRTLGPQVEAWVRCELPKPTLEPGRLAGEVLFVDHFGNLITNIPGESLAMVTGTPRIQVAGQEIWQRVRSYAEAEPGTAVALVSSNGMLEIAVTNGNAAQQMDAQVGSPVLVTPAEHDPSPPASGSGIDPGAALAMETFSSAIPRRTVHRGMQSGVFIALVLVPLISYSILATIAVAILLMRPQAWDPFEVLPDREGDLKGAKHQKQAVIISDRVAPDRGLPQKLKVELGQTIRLGDLEITPQHVELRRLVFRRPGFVPEPAGDDSLVLHLLVHNISQDVVFSPTDPFFDRSWKGLSSGKKPYTCLEIGRDRLWGGPLPWSPSQRPQERDTIEGQQYKTLQPGEQLATLVCTDPEDHVGRLLTHFRGQLLWHVQVRRGLVEVHGREYAATAVIGVPFQDTEIQKPAM